LRVESPLTVPSSRADSILPLGSESARLLLLGSPKCDSEALAPARAAASACKIPGVAGDVDTPCTESESVDIAVACCLSDPPILVRPGETTIGLGGAAGVRADPSRVADSDACEADVSPRARFSLLLAGALVLMAAADVSAYGSSMELRSASVS
jgi:hypothetical protein